MKSPAKIALSLSIHIYIYICIYIYTFTYITCIYMHLCMQYIHVCVYICMYVCVYIYIYLCIYIYIYIYTYMYIQVSCLSIVTQAPALWMLAFDFGDSRTRQAGPGGKNIYEVTS